MHYGISVNNFQFSYAYAYAIRQLQDTVHKLLSDECQSVLRSLAEFMCVDIAAIEARHSSNREVTLLRSRGWAPSLSSLSSRLICHTLQTLSSYWQDKDDKYDKDKDQDKDHNKKSGKSGKTKRGGGGAWQAFVHENSSGTQFDSSSMAILAEKYRRLTPSEKARYQEAGQAATLAAKFGIKAYGSRKPKRKAIHEPPLQPLMPGESALSTSSSGAITAAASGFKVDDLMTYTGADLFMEQYDEVCESSIQEYRASMRQERLSQEETAALRRLAGGTGTTSMVSYWKKQGRHALISTLFKVGQFAKRFLSFQWVPPARDLVQDKLLQTKV